MKDHSDRHHHSDDNSHRRRRARRLFDYGELRVLLLAMIAKNPCHGYELIKLIEERFEGGYSPSPGVIYPTLAWLDDMGYAAIELKEAGRKLYRITATGEAFILANRAAADELLARSGFAADDGRGSVPAPIIRGMENLKLALRLRLERGAIDTETTKEIAQALDAAAQAVERS